MRKKLSSSSGLTLSEMLVAVAVSSLVALAVAVGVSAAVSVYHSSVEFSESQVLFSTLSQAVTDELRYARDITVTKENGQPHVTFTSTNYGLNCEFGQNREGQITVVNSAGTETLLVSSGAYSKGAFRAELDALAYQNGIFTVDIKILDRNDQHLIDRNFAVMALN